MAASSRGWVLFATVAVAAAAVDLVSKSAAFTRLGMPGSGRAAVLVPRILVLETNLNEGALFGMGQGMGLGFAAVSVVAIAGILALMARRSTRDDGW
ncbi:MAG: signal peptidase II, partial [Planctomycetia bacterium]|nr:signal peptidase II [Planctomycetia bacterium]